MIEYRIETIAGNGEPGDTPEMHPTPAQSQSTCRLAWSMGQTAVCLSRQWEATVCFVSIPQAAS